MDYMVDHPGGSRLLRRFFWIGGGGAAMFLGTFLVFDAVSRHGGITARNLGHDFMAFYTAGTFVRAGRTGDLYDLQSVREFQRDLMRQHGLSGLQSGESLAPWWNPPFYAWVFVPLSAMPYPQALLVWRVIGLLCLAGAIALLVAMFGPRAEPRRDWRWWALVPLLVVISSPFVQALTHGQNTLTSLLILCVAVALWRAQRAFWAGLVAAILFYKPQLAAVVALVLVYDLGWRALLGGLLTGAALLLATVLSMPSAIERYIHQLPINVHFMQIEQTYLWERHVTLKAMWRMLLQGRAPGEPTALLELVTYASIALLAAALLMAAWRSRTSKRDPRCPVRRDRLISATIMAMPLLMPFYFDYDLLLLAVPAVLMAREMSRIRPAPLDRCIAGAWIALFFWAYNNAGFGLWSCVNVSAMLLSILAALTIARLQLAVGDALRSRLRCGML